MNDKFVPVTGLELEYRLASENRKIKNSFPY